MAFEVYFRRTDASNDCVVYNPTAARPDVSLLHRQADGFWHCALCDSTQCRHTSAADAAIDSEPAQLRPSDASWLRPRWRQRHRVLAALFAVSGIAATLAVCTPFRTYGGDGVRVHVQNESRHPVVVSAIVNGEARHLGRVHPNDYPFFDVDLPPGRTEALVVIGAPEGEEEFRTDTVATEAGTALLLNLRHPWNRSTWSSH